MRFEVFALNGMPEVRTGADLAVLIAQALEASGERLANGDIIAIAQKVVSKAEGRIVDLSTVSPGREAVELAERCEKDARLVQLVLDESRRVVRAVPGVLIVETKHGFVCANAGIDRSNLPGADERVLLLPDDPDASAQEVRGRIERLMDVKVGVLISDSFGRAWRVGQADQAIGCAGLSVLSDARGAVDRAGRELTASIQAVADELASAANLSRKKASGHPIAVIRGRSDLVRSDAVETARQLLRDPMTDLFRI